MRLLLVEDHPHFASVVIRTFLYDHEVTHVTTVAAARVALSAGGGGFDAVLVDHDLEDGTGVEVVQAVQAASNLSRIVAISARTEGNEAMREAGAHAICNKTSFQHIRQVLKALRRP